MATLTLTGSNANTLTGTNVSGGTVATTGDDTISASSAQISGSTIDGNGGTDVLQLTGGGAFNLKAAALLNVTSIKLMSSSTVTGTTGADLISGSGAEDTLIGDLGNDTLHGDAHHDVLSGGDGNDSLYGGLNNDTLYGDAGDDTLSGGAHADMLFGGAGNDVFAISSSTDFVAGETIDGGDGTDTILLVSASGLQYDFSGAISIERIEHSGNQDFGITGGANNELIIGGSGRQTLLGGAGEDTISGGAGNDTITGGDGNDVFQFAASGEGNDLITDFAPGDLIRVAGRSSGGSITNGGSTVAANSVQVSTSNGVTTLYVDTDGVADAAELTVLLTGTYLSGDFAFSGADITRNAPVFTTGTDTFTDTSGNALAVGAGVGTINAGDTIDGGDGNDTLAAMLADGETTGAATIAGFDNLNIAVASGQSATFNALNVTDSTLKPNGAGLHVITNASVRVEGAGMTGAGRLDLAFADTISGFYGGIGFGGSNSDTLHGGNGNDTIYGVGGADTLLGEGGNDVLSGGPGNDSMVGGDGADGLSGGDGADTLLGGDGNDTVNFAVAELAGGDSVDGGAGTDTLQLNSGGSFDLSGLSFTNFEVIRGSTAHDTITGNFGSTPYLFEGLNGNDSIVGGGGNDTLSGGGGNDTLSGGAGDDVFSLGTSTGEITASELIDGGTGNDTIWLTSFGSYNLSQPTLNGIESIVVANALSASVTGGAADDSIVGNAAVDLLLGGAGNDTLSGGDGNDTLSGGAGNDLLAGGEGNDLFALAAANIAGSTDTLSGGNGTDAIVLGGAGIYDFSAVEIHGVEQVLGSSGNDGISGLADADVTSAGFLVDGGGGNDTLAGGTGNDTLSGGSGNDVFAFASTGNGTDRIADIAENEIIRVTGRASTGGTVTDGDGSNVAANSVQVSTSGGVTTLYIDTNGAAGAAELTVTLTGTFAARNFALSGTDITHVVPPIFSTGTDNYTDDPGNALTAAAATGTINAGDTVDAGDGTDTLNATLANGETTGPATLTGWENLNLTVASGATATFDAQNVSASTLKPVGAGAHVITNASVSVDASGLTGAGTLNATFTGGNVTAIGGAGRDTLSGGSGADTLSGAAGNDLLYGGDGNDVFGYAATDTGQVDVIGDFAAGDVIRVGSATLGGIASGTGTGLAARGVQVGATSGGFTPLYVDLDGNGGAADLTINLAGSFTADTLRVSNNEISVYTAPPSTGGGGGDNGGGGTTQTVDGVTVQQTTQTASDGTRTETLTVPIITAGRTEENAATPNADIPLARDSGGQDLLTAHVPVGVGLTVESTTTTASGVQGL
ncbi:beta strand repeat-containing protein, partial [Azospirillum sp.]|uniref:beta strand repeat-containing protein n=1 Tax=Azospirillum sp. TaxID=34012 RepID=UPI002D330398|nr:hypothetical protein [Azospirillum sp.]